MTDPVVDIFLPTYNGEKYLSNAVESVLFQTYPSWRLTIVDDHSTDSTGEIAKNFEVKYPDRIQVLKKSGLKGAPSSRMEAAEKTSGEYIAFLDQDDIWRNDKLELQVNQIKMRHADLCYSNVELIDSKGNLMLKAADGENSRRGRSHTNLDPLALAKSYIDYCPIRIGTVLLSRESFLRSGGFDIKLFGGEDWEFWVRFALLGNTVCFLDEKVAYRRIHDENTSTRHRVARLDSWMRAAEKIAMSHAELAANVRTFQGKTFRRELRRNLLAGRRAATSETLKGFRSLGIISLTDLVLAKAVLIGWPVLERTAQSLRWLKKRL